MSSSTDADVDRYFSGEAELKDLLGLDPGYLESVRQRAQYFIEAEAWERALLLLELLEAVDRTDQKPALLASQALLELGRHDEARLKLLPLLDYPAVQVDALVLLARLHLRRAQLAEAAVLLKQACALDPEFRTDAGRRALDLIREATSALGLSHK